MHFFGHARNFRQKLSTGSLLGHDTYSFRWLQKRMLARNQRVRLPEMQKLIPGWARDINEATVIIKYNLGVLGAIL